MTIALQKNRKIEYKTFINMLKVLHRYASIASRDFTINGNILRVNKFGVHKLNPDCYVDTGQGFSYGYWTSESFTHNEFISDSETDLEYREINEYITENIQDNDDVLPAKLKITIYNHAFPVIKMNNKSTLFLDGNLKWIYPDGGLKTIPINKPDIQSNSMKFKMENVKHELPVIEFPGNQYSFVWYKQSVFTKSCGIQFCNKPESESSDINEYPEQVREYLEKMRDPTRVNFLPHAPGGVSNLGHFRDGTECEKWFASEKTYNLNIYVSPGIKRNHNSRYPATDYPFLPKTEKRHWKYNDTYDTDDIVTVISPDCMMTQREIIDKKAWEHEYTFGIIYEWD
jgi:hypothetical protein